MLSNVAQGSIARDPQPTGVSSNIEGISHITFIVRDVQRMAQILTQVLQAQEVYSSSSPTAVGPEEKFFLIGELWVAILQGDPLPTKTYNHIAFKIPEAALPEYQRRVEALDLEILPSRSRQSGEGKSLYFYDEDHHLFELHTGTLAERLATFR
ncbi:MAG: FosX/FosE/FosI family fosfomycin resistance hydrolase [Thermostichus sp. DG02_5_bins_236]